MTAKIALCGAVTLLCAMTGKSFAGTNARRAKLLAELMDALQLLKVHMLDRLMPLEAALSLSKSLLLIKVGEHVAKSGAYNAWQTIKSREMKRGGIMDCLSVKDAEVLERLFEALGSSGRNEQRPIIDSAIKELGLLEAQARSESGEKGRLYTILGALAGVAIVIFII